jgi:hypothetical protein
LLHNKILYITPYIPFPTNKAANLFISKRISLLSQIYNIELLSVTNGKYDTNINNHKISRYVSSFDFVNRDNVSIGAICKAIFCHEPLFNVLSKSIIDTIENKIQKNEYDFVMIEHSYLSSMIVKNIPSIAPKVITVFHNIETDYFLDLYKKTSFFNPKKYFYFIEYRGCKKVENELYASNSKAFWFLSKQDLEFVKKQTKNQNLLLSSTISFDLKKHISDEKKYDLLYMGQLDNQRNLHGLEWFIKNVWILLENKNLTFAIAGRGNIDEIKRLTKEYKGIDIVGEVDNLDEIFSKSKITIIPIFNTIGVQTKLFDSLAQGNVVICTEDAINGTNFVDEQHLLVAKDEIDFKEKILSVLNNESKYEYIYKNLESIKDDFKDEILLENMQRSMNEK